MIMARRRILELDLFRIGILAFSLLVFFLHSIIAISNTVAIIFIGGIVICLVWTMRRYAKMLDAHHLSRWENILGITGIAASTVLAMLFIGLGIEGGSIAQRIWSIGDGTLVEIATLTTIGIALFLRSG